MRKNMAQYKTSSLVCCINDTCRSCSSRDGGHSYDTSLPLLVFPTLWFLFFHNVTESFMVFREAQYPQA